MPWKKPGHHVSTKISQDFKTGETVTKDVLKQDLFPAKCVYTVELYDAETGELVQKQTAENRLSAYIINCLFRQTFIENFMYYSKNNNDLNVKHIGNRLGQIFNSGAPYSSLFSSLLLTTNSKILEDPYDPYVWGKPVGMSSITQASPGKSQYSGMLNTEETTIKRENGKITKHFVVDFATNQGNGTFQSIYITGAGNSSNYMNPHGYIYNDAQEFPDTNASKWNDPLYHAIPCARNVRYPSDFNDYPVKYIFTPDMIYQYFLGTQTTSSSRYEIKERKLYPIDRSTNTVMTPLEVPDKVFYLAYDGTYFFGVTTDNKIYKLDGKMSIISTISMPGQFPGKILPDYCAINSIAVDNKYIYVSFSGNTTTNNNDQKGALALMVLTKTGVFVKLLYLAENGKQNSAIRGIGGLTFLPNNKLLVTTYFWTSVYVDLSDWSFYDWGELGSISMDRDPVTDLWYSSNYRHVGAVTDDTAWRYEYWFFPYYIIPATSHTLLPSPVTKTSANTMKIQYDLVVDDIGYFDKL